MLLCGFLALHVARGCEGGVQPGCIDVGAALCVLPVSARLQAGPCRLQGSRVNGFASVQGKLRFAFGGPLSAQIFRPRKLVGCRFSPSDDTAALIGQLRKQRRLLFKQLVAERCA